MYQFILSLFDHNASSHAVDPATDNCPLGQPVQALASTALYVWAGQYMHSVLLADPEYWPAGHAMHADAAAFE